MKHLVLFLLLLCAPLCASLPDADLAAADKIRFHHLCEKLVAPCCWTQSVELHSSPAADQLRLDIVGMIKQRQSDRQILDWFIKQYGERILIEPEGVKSVVLTTVPIVLLAGGLAGLGWFLLRLRKPTVAAPAEAILDLVPDSEWE
jgi:cytochrome c-type biogenesis protein CcmH